MDLQEKTQLILQALRGLKMHEWEKIKRAIDICYQSEAVKVKLNDFERLQKLLSDDL